MTLTYLPPVFAEVQGERLLPAELAVVVVDAQPFFDRVQGVVDAAPHARQHRERVLIKQKRLMNSHFLRP